MPDVNAAYEQLNREVRADFADALAATEYRPQFGPLIEEFNVDDTIFSYEFILDNRGFEELKKNLAKKNVIKKMITMFTKEYGDELAVPKRKLTSRHGDAYRKQARQMGAGVGQWQDEKVSALLKAGGPAFTEDSWDGVPFFSASHPLDLAGEVTGTHSNLDSGGGGQYWYLFDLRRIKPIALNWKTRIELTEFGLDSEWCKDNYEVKWKAYLDAGFGLTLWHYAYASNQTLNAANFRAAREALEVTPKYTKNDEAGASIMGVMPTLLVVGRSNRGAAEELLNATNLSNGASNTLYKAIDFLPLTYLP